MIQWVIGFDLSLTAPAAVALPLNWRPGAWKVPRASIVRPEAPETTDMHGQVVRYGEILNWATEFVANCKERAGPISGVFMEGYGYSKNNSNASRIMELGGVFKYTLYNRLRFVVTPVAVNSARALFFGKGKTPRKDPKLAVQFALDKAGAPKAWEENICDAFVVANYGLSESGGTALTLTEGL